MLRLDDEDEDEGDEEMGELDAGAGIGSWGGVCKPIPTAMPPMQGSTITPTAMPPISV
jgi:hypothetical protein